MPVTTGDAPFQRGWIGRAGEHSRVVIAFEDQRIASIQHGADMRRHFPDVSQHTKAATAGGKNILHRFARIVRHGKRLKFQRPESKGAMAIDDAQVETDIVFAASRPGTMGQPDRQRVATREPEDTTEMVTMLVRAMGLTPTATQSRFADNDAIPDYARGFAALAAEYGIVNGKADGRFHAVDPTTRAEAAKVLSVLLEALAGL